MESSAKLSHDPLPVTINTSPSDVLLQHLRSALMEFLTFSTLIVVASLETYFILLSWKSVLHFLFLFCFVLLLVLKSFLSKAPSVYLVDFSCLKPPSFCRVPFSSFIENTSRFESVDAESVSFMAKVLASSGQSEETCLPPALHYIPPKTHHEESVKEVHMVLFPVMEDLLSKTRLSPRDVDILVVNCSGFCPSPSLSSIIINKYSMRSDIKSYTLSGMGCSASLVGIHLAQNLLKIHRNSYAVVLSAEILSSGWYSGNERPMLLLNCLFRMGSAAILLSNKKEASRSSKYKLSLSLRSQRSFDDKAYLSAIREEDSKGNLGVTLTRDLLQVAGETLRSNITVLGCTILPLSEKVWLTVSLLRKKYIDKSCEMYVPNFKTVIRHFCLPASGRPVIREIAKGLKLGNQDVEPALMTLHRFGNQSSSSLWYELAYLEAKERVKKGDKVWQLGMGTGPKCSSVLWECIRPITGESKSSPWADCIGRYPIVAIDQEI